MAQFDAEKFEDKYVHYLRELESAYKRAFDVMNEQYNSDLIHAIDQQVLNSSEPIHVGDGQFRIDIPDQPKQRIEGVLVDDETFNTILDAYIDQLETELRRSFGFVE